MARQQICGTNEMSTLTRHQDSRHVLVATRYDDHTIEPMSSCCRLNLIRDQVPRLQGVGHSAGTHADPVAHTDGTKLVSDDSLFRERSLDMLSET